MATPTPATVIPDLHGREMSLAAQRVIIMQSGIGFVKELKQGNQGASAIVASGAGMVPITWGYAVDCFQRIAPQHDVQTSQLIREALIAASRKDELQEPIAKLSADVLWDSLPSGNARAAMTREFVGVGASLRTLFRKTEAKICTLFLQEFGLNEPQIHRRSSYKKMQLKIGEAFFNSSPDLSRASDVLRIGTRIDGLVSASEGADNRPQGIRLRLTNGRSSRL